MGVEERITLQEWVEAIQDVASIERALRETSNPQKQHLLFRARQEAVERVLAMRYLTGATTDRIEAILETEQWAAAFYQELSEEPSDDMGEAYSRLEKHGESPPDAGEVSSWYSSASPFRREPEKQG